MHPTLIRQDGLWKIGNKPHTIFIMRLLMFSSCFSLGIFISQIHNIPERIQNTQTFNIKHMALCSQATLAAVLI